MKRPSFQPVTLPLPCIQHFAVCPVAATISVYLYNNLTVTVSPTFKPSVKTFANEGRAFIEPLKLL